MTASAVRLKPKKLNCAVTYCRLRDNIVAHLRQTLICFQISPCCPLSSGWVRGRSVWWAVILGSPQKQVAHRQDFGYIADENPRVLMSAVTVRGVYATTNTPIREVVVSVPDGAVLMPHTCRYAGRQNVVQSTCTLVNTNRVFQTADASQRLIPLCCKLMGMMYTNHGIRDAALVTVWLQQSCATALVIQGLTHWV